MKLTKVSKYVSLLNLSVLSLINYDFESSKKLKNCLMIIHRYLWVMYLNTYRSQNFMTASRQLFLEMLSCFLSCFQTVETIILTFTYILTSVNKPILLSMCYFVSLNFKRIRQGISNWSLKKSPGLFNRKLFLM